MMCISSVWRSLYLVIFLIILSNNYLIFLFVVFGDFNSRLLQLLYYIIVLYCSRARAFAQCYFGGSLCVLSRAGDPDCRDGC